MLPNANAIFQTNNFVSSQWQSQKQRGEFYTINEDGICFRQTAKFSPIQVL